MNTNRGRRLLTIVMAFTIILAVAVSFAYVQRAHDRKNAERQAAQDSADRTRDRNNQLAFFCYKHNVLVIAALGIVDPPGAPQFPQRVRAKELLAGALCSPSEFKLDPAP